MFTCSDYVSICGVYEWSEPGSRDMDCIGRMVMRPSEREQTSQYRNRAYHPGLGRFMSEDPKLFDAGDNNFFRYCANDPLDRTDPMGLETPPDNEERPYVSPGGDWGAGISRVMVNPSGAIYAKSSMQKLSAQMHGGFSMGPVSATQSGGQFAVSAQALNARQMAGIRGASASDFTTVYTDTAHFDSYKVEQLRSDGKVDSSGKVTSWGNFHSDPALTGRAAQITQLPTGVKVQDRVGKVQAGGSLPGHAVLSHGQLPVLSFNPTAVKIQTSIYGMPGDQFRGTNTFSGVWNQNSVPHYEGVDQSY